MANRDYYQICARHSGKSLDINGGPRATGNGAGAQQWTYWGGDNQMFKLTAVGRGAACDVTDPLTSNFSAAAELRTTHPYAAGPFPSDVNLTVKFSNRHLVIPITLRLENSNLLFGNSTLSLRLAAEGEADAKNAVSGSVTLRGTGTFVGGALNGSQGTLAVTGLSHPDQGSHLLG